MPEKHLVFTEEPDYNGYDVVYYKDNDKHYLDISNIDGLQTLHLIRKNHLIVNYNEQSELSRTNHKITSGYVQYENLQQPPKTLAEWIDKSGAKSFDFNYHRYIFVETIFNGSKITSLHFDSIGIDGLINRSGSKNEFTFSMPFIKGLQEKFGENAKIFFGYNDKHYKSLALKIQGNGKEGTFDISYDPPPAPARQSGVSSSFVGEIKKVKHI
ncbi:hypothetical protein LY01_01645 [Nonlabens xylanidelens]|uniref:Uncharacterized protein n=1 Tax=Nonlabens xylanidelens TaxID=191564 RepID=A0A2S6IKY3_9FLAO|nr:hypothetical protein [Nonlabens xylanidelens]PPK94892.1 hypothetical protein LY01_01645 [Nonlabens xylanidelens]PQJ17440.1 hypothetical protein BST94_10295 [Nonlabens xylanidelens]